MKLQPNDSCANPNKVMQEQVTDKFDQASVVSYFVALGFEASDVRHAYEAEWRRQHKEMPGKPKKKKLGTAKVASRARLTASEQVQFVDELMMRLKRDRQRIHECIQDAHEEKNTVEFWRSAAGKAHVKWMERLSELAHGLRLCIFGNRSEKEPKIWRPRPLKPTDTVTYRRFIDVERHSKR